ncbi:protein kinase [Strigomonas culicis]|uniref:non-specific serine/threonine protein kinase n=1 Tax=Strigomonas culicis TaxID=28005 RepID=S9V7R9_9TRYP|nr:protein kinase [Strigomonas culicis]|eukprot:EPY18995.1 protein kinase [Strigomonas culicis]
MEEYRVKFILLQLTLGLHYMHVHKKILHRDLKPANVLLCTNGLVKIGDFGLSNAYDTISGDVGRTLCGTPPYVAPELWQRRRYGRAADMWSLGVLLYECMTSRMPFAGRQLEALQRSILAEDPPPILGSYSGELRDLVQRLLSKEPTARPDSMALLHLPYIQRACSEFPQVLEASQVPAAVQSLIFMQIQKQQLPPQRVIDTTLSFEGVVEKFKPPHTFVLRQLRLEGGMLYIEKCSATAPRSTASPTSTVGSPLSPPAPAGASFSRPSSYSRQGLSAAPSANVSMSACSTDAPFTTGSESSSSRRRRGCVPLSSIYHVECIDRSFLAIRIDDSDFNFFRTAHAEEWRDVLLRALGIAPAKAAQPPMVAHAPPENGATVDTHV